MAKPADEYEMIALKSTVDKRRCLSTYYFILDIWPSLGQMSLIDVVFVLYMYTCMSTKDESYFIQNILQSLGQMSPIDVMFRTRHMST